MDEIKLVIVSVISAAAGIMVTSMRCKKFTGLKKFTES